MKIQLMGACALAAGSLVSLSYSGLAVEDDFLEGVVHPFRIVHVGAATEGLLSEVLVERGDHVAPGDVLGRLSFGVEEAAAQLAEARRDATSDLQIATTKLGELRSQLERREQLFERSIINAEVIEETRIAVRIQELNVQAAQENHRIAQLEASRARAAVERGTITSPLGGIVTERFLSQGEMLSRSGAANLVTIAQLDPLWIEVYAPIELYQSFQVGDTCLVDIYGPQPTQHRARIQVVDRLIDTASDTFRVRLEMPNPEASIPAGLRCRVHAPQ